MSGHSKWSTIKHKKAANDAVKSGIFTKIAGLITVAARKGNSGDPDKNFSLRLAVEKAKAANMPKDKIEKAIEKGIGRGENEELTELVIEGYGPEGVAVVITALTNNRNRTVAELKNLMEKHGGRMGEPGSVMYQFERVGLITLENQISDQDGFELIDLGVIDFESAKEGSRITTKIEDLQKIIEVILGKGYLNVNGEIGYRAKTLVKPASGEKVEEFLNIVADHADVQEIYANI